ncbi:MAG: hypothetical protein IJW24_05000, partial [Clostridia bacterium]|nr:hypothetical protein [Clostridia bacterium]
MCPLSAAKSMGDERIVVLAWACALYVFEHGKKLKLVLDKSLLEVQVLKSPGAQDFAVEFAADKPLAGICPLPDVILAEIVLEFQRCFHAVSPLPFSVSIPPDRASVFGGIAAACLACAR